MHNYKLYDEAMELLGKSTHEKQRSKRAAKYPGHIIEVDGLWYISYNLFYAYFEYKLALRKLVALKEKEVPNG